MRFIWFMVFLLVGFAPANAQVGSAVPMFSLMDSEGTTHMPEQYRGKVLVLFLFGFS
jgi:peroxiredoxin